MDVLQSPVFWILVVAAIMVGLKAFLKSRRERSWGFKDVVKNPGYWDRADKSFAEAERAVETARTWDNATVSAAVTKYLFETTSSNDAWVEMKMLCGLGRRTHPRVLELLADKDRFPRWVIPTGKAILPEAPFHRACDLLGDTPPVEAIPLLAPFLDHSDKSIRQSAAVTLGKTGDPAIVPLLKRALADPEEYVRGYALMGLQWSRKTGTLDPTTSDALFDDVRRLVEDERNERDSAGVLFALDPARACEVFLSPTIFHPDSRILDEALEAMADGMTNVPRDRLLEVITPLRKPEIEYRQKCTLGQALRLLGRHQHPDDRQLLESLQEHRDETIANGATQGILSWHGVEGFEKRLWDRMKEEGYASLTRLQQHYTTVLMLDGEIKNGGFEQYFVNSSGDHWRDALEGLKAMKAGKHLDVFEKAIAKFGKNGPATDRRARQDQLAKITRTRDDAFEALNRPYHEIAEGIEVLASRYALANPEDFR